MKKLIIIFLALIAFSSCKNSKSSKKETQAGFENISWESEKIKEYQLIRPIEFRKGAVDAYGLRVSKNSWYLINKKTDCYLLPVGDLAYVFFDKCVKSEEIAIVDTMFAGLMSNTKKFEVLSIIGGVNKMEILCFKKGYSVCPVLSVYSGQPTVAYFEH